MELSFGNVIDIMKHKSSGKHTNFCKKVKIGNYIVLRVSLFKYCQYILSQGENDGPIETRERCKP